MGNSLAAEVAGIQRAEESAIDALCLVLKEQASDQGWSDRELRSFCNFYAVAVPSGRDKFDCLFQNLRFVRAVNFFFFFFFFFLHVSPC